MLSLAIAALAAPVLPAAVAGDQGSSTRGGVFVQTDAEVAADEAGPHKGGGQTVGHSFFRDLAGLKLVFRKRVLKPGAGIGHHVQAEDEIYYVIGGQGRMTLDGKTVDVGPGTAILTRTGSSHSLRQVGGEDLVLIIVYEQAAK
jgi:mannose-6-phosphate isomerase-like protein (cupin superfamily)